MGTRDTANTTEPTTLSFQFYRNGIKADAFAINRVMIYKSNSDAVNNLNPIATIENTSISRPSVGLYQYTTPVITSTGLYFDKMYLTPVTGANEYSFINSFVVENYTSTGGSVTLPICQVYGNLVDGSGDPFANAKINFIVDTIPAVENNTHTGIVPQAVSCVTTSTGYFTVNLVQQFTYRVDIKCMNLHERIQVPSQTSTDLWSLTAIPVLDTAGPTNPSTGGDW